MQKVIFFRPGECKNSRWTDNLCITDSGRVKTKASARQIENITSHKSIKILSASNEISEESADIFDETFMTIHKSSDLLCHEPEEICTFTIMKALDLIRTYNNQTDILIVIVDCPFLIDLHRYFVREWQNIDIDIEDIEPSCGMVVCLNGSELSYLVHPDDIHTAG